MLSEMIDRIVDLSADTDSLDLLYETSRKRAYDNRGQIVIDVKEIPPRRHNVFSLPDLVDAIVEYGNLERVTVWVSESKIIVVLNDCNESFRDDMLQMNLPLSPFFAVLSRATWLDQKQFIDLLRHDLCGTVIEPTSTLSLLRQLKFTLNTEQNGTVTNSSAAMGKSALAEVTGAGELPETVKVEYCPYPSLRDDLSADVTVDCTLFTDASSAKLKLSPRPGEIEAAKLTAMQLVQKKLRDLLTTKTEKTSELHPLIQVYLGDPGN